MYYLQCQYCFVNIELTLFKVMDMLCMEISGVAWYSMGDILGGDNTMLGPKCYIQRIPNRGNGRVVE